jgi:hypothetical protein
LLIASAPATVCAQAATATSVTLFTSGQVLVRRTLPITIPAGESTQSLELGDLTPASLKPLDVGVAIVRINSDVTWSEDALLRRNIGHVFEFEQADRSRRRATLLSLDPEHWEWDGGGVVFGRPGQIIWPRNIVPTGRVVDVTLQSDRARRALSVMYETTGGSWFANYSLFLGAAGRLEGVATVSTGTLDLANAEVQLFAGDIGSSRYQPSRPPVGPTGRSSFYGRGVEGGTGSALVPRDEVNTRQTLDETVGEAHIYTLPGRISFVAGMQTVLPIFAPISVTSHIRYVVPGSEEYDSRLEPDPTERSVAVTVAYDLPHVAGTPFGNLALPTGNVSIFQPDNAGRIQLVGHGSFDHTSPGEELLVEAGTAYDVTAHRTQTAYTAAKSGQPEVTTALATYQVTLRNARDSAVIVEVREERRGDWSVPSSSVPAERPSATRAVFKVTVPANGTSTLTYAVRSTW